MNKNFTIPAFAEPITGLPDTPTCAANELKRRFQAPADEVRVAHNALAEAHEKLDTKVEGIVTETFAGAIHESMFDEELTEKLNSKAEQTSLDTVDNRLAAAESTLQTQANQIAQRCQIYIGTYTGDGTESKTISLGFRPKAVIVYCEGYIGYNDGRIQGGLILDGTPMTFSSAYQPAAEIISSGFIVRRNDQRHQMNINQVFYSYLAFRA